MKRSTATYISYNLRPAKQIERRLLLDFVKCVCSPSCSTSELRYVGMGGTLFYDFHLAHRFLGISNMVSLERSKDAYVRSEFNCPFGFIDTRNETVGSFLASDRVDTTTVYWLDYDDGINTEIITDITSLGTQLKVGGCAFVTVCAEPPGILDKCNAEQRLDHFQENFQDLAGGLGLEDMETSGFPLAVYRVLRAAFDNAFAAHPSGRFLPLFQVQYKDSMEMVTVGGVLCSTESLTGIAHRLKADLPFLAKDKLYKIQNFNLTERERLEFDKAVTSDAKLDVLEDLRKLGFKKRDFDAYRDLVRFLPRYSEGII